VKAHWTGSQEVWFFRSVPLCYHVYPTQDSQLSWASVASHLKIGVLDLSPTHLRFYNEKMGVHVPQVEWDLQIELILSSSISHTW
jgi:hypothetical protein